MMPLAQLCAHLYPVDYHITHRTSDSPQTSASSSKKPDSSILPPVRKQVRFATVPAGLGWPTATNQQVSWATSRILGGYGSKTTYKPVETKGTSHQKGPGSRLRIELCHLHGHGPRLEVKGQIRSLQLEAWLLSFLQTLHRIKEKSSRRKGEVMTTLALTYPTVMILPMLRLSGPSSSVFMNSL